MTKEVLFKTIEDIIGKNRGIKGASKRNLIKKINGSIEEFLQATVPTTEVIGSRPNAPTITRPNPKAKKPTGYTVWDAQKSAMHEQR